MSQDIRGSDPGDRRRRSRRTIEMKCGWTGWTGRVTCDLCTAPSGVVRGDNRHLIRICLLFTRKPISRCCGVFFFLLLEKSGREHGSQRFKEGSATSSARILVDR